MKIVRVRYLALLPLRQDLQRIFPNWDGTRQDIEDSLKKRHVYVKRVPMSEIDGSLKHFDVYALVRDSFSPPLWLQGVVTPHSDLDPYSHRWQGHEVKVDDAANEEPDNEVIT